MIEKGWFQAICDDCQRVVFFTNQEHLLSSDWAIARNRKNCYCFKCAPAHRHTGRNGPKVKINGRKKV